MQTLFYSKRTVEPVMTPILDSGTATNSFMNRPIPYHNQKITKKAVEIQEEVKTIERDFPYSVPHKEFIFSTKHSFF